MCMNCHLSVVKDEFPFPFQISAYIIIHNLFFAGNNFTTLNVESREWRYIYIYKLSRILIKYETTRKGRFTDFKE